MISRIRPAVPSIRGRTFGTEPAVIGQLNQIYQSSNKREKDTRTWVRVFDLPRIISPADIYRHATALNLEGLYNVHLDHKNFMPSGRGWLRFGQPEQAQIATEVLGTSVVAAHRIRAQLTEEADMLRAGFPPRTRGEKGRAEAVERGLISGNGPDAKLKERGSNVYIWGLPGTITASDLAKIFDSYGLKVTAEERLAVRKIFRNTPTSRFLVRLNSIEGAHRLVRDFHMTDKFGEGYTARAQVIY